MDVRTSSKVLAAVVLVVLISFSAYAFADQGPDCNRQGKGMRYEEAGCGGQGWKRHGMGKLRFDHGFRGNLSDEALEEAAKDRDTFIESTEGLRRHIRQKKLELRAELDKETPDADKAIQIQKEISNLKTNFDGQRIEHRLRMKKIHPELGQGFGFRKAGKSGDVGPRPCRNYND